ncbi:pilus (MSHA type) biogenesis protein MshL [Sulfuriflexus mobilis]|uniref:pilus (MSHA type) biogenesis protein MshL n=1 Tax=Sulfuriflexus mobilis TaxID=1811807 RepID=UPI000F818302|nr:pilus (MSHA type) biogenesis protein MshL [Sulfuriflexus mobilis]
MHTSQHKTSASKRPVCWPVLAGVVVAVFLSACATKDPKGGTTIDDIHATLQEGIDNAEQGMQQTPQSVSDALVPPININVPGEVDIPESRFDIAVKEAEARSFFMGLVDGTHLNMVVHPDVTGSISLTLKDVTIPEVMTVLRDVYGYEYRQNGNVYQVLPRRLHSRIFEVNYLNVIRSGKSQTRVSSGQVSQPSAESSTSGTTNGTTRTTSSNNASLAEISGSQVETNSEADFWSELRTSLGIIIGNSGGRSVVINPQSGVVVVRAMPSELRDVARFLNTTQDVVERQVILEAKIIEVELSDGFRSGINWAALGEPGRGKTIVGGQTGGGSLFGNGASEIQGQTGNLNPQNLLPVDNALTSAFGGVFSLALNLNDFTAFIELLETQGNVQVLSSPRVSTVNNQKAVIKVGTDEFFVTEVSSTTITGTTTTSTPSVTLTPFFSGIALDVIPQIDEDNNVILHIHPTVSEVAEQIKVITIGGEQQSLPLAQSSVRESDSIVRAQSNQIVVIGGLMQNSTREDIGSTPLLGDIPVVGSLFRHTQQSSRKSELVILLRPIVVDSDSVWKGSLQKSSDRFHKLDQGFHFGGKSEVFGTRAE